MFNGWLEENENYAGQGHRRGMLMREVTAIGMGHVICNGVHYWVMELRAPVASPNTATSAVNATQNVTVQAESSYLDGVQLSVPAYEQMTIGESYTLAPQLFLKGKNVIGWETKVPIQASYTVTASDPSVLKCTALGSGQWKMEAPGAGTCTLTVSSSSSVGSPSLSFTVTVGKVNMDYADISLAQTEYTWNGTAVCPKPVITYHGEVLKEGVDYTLSYLRNDGCTRNKGGAFVSAIAISSGRFSGFRSIGFEILAADIGKQKISLSPAEYVYDGMLKEPEVIIPGLIKNKDFRVEYQNNLSVGTAKAVVSGLGNYTGRTTVTFTIRSKNSAASSESQKSTAVSLKRPVISSAVNKKGKKIKITWKKQSGVTGYQIRYKTGKKTKTVKVKKSSAKTKTVSGLKKGKTYTIALRSYKKSGGKTIYSAWSKKKKVKVKK